MYELAKKSPNENVCFLTDLRQSQRHTVTHTEAIHTLSFKSEGTLDTHTHKFALCLQNPPSTEGVNVFPLTDGNCAYSELLQHIKCHLYEYS